MLPKPSRIDGPRDFVFIGTAGKYFVAAETNNVVTQALIDHGGREENTRKVGQRPESNNVALPVFLAVSPVIDNDRHGFSGQGMIDIRNALRIPPAATGQLLPAGSILVIGRNQ
jgi:hypothetical protein